MPSQNTIPCGQVVSSVIPGGWAHPIVIPVPRVTDVPIDTERAAAPRMWSARV